MTGIPSDWVFYGWNTDKTADAPSTWEGGNYNNFFKVNKRTSVRNITLTAYYNGESISHTITIPSLSNTGTGDSSTYHKFDIVESGNGWVVNNRDTKNSVTIVLHTHIKNQPSSSYTEIGAYTLEPISSSSIIGNKNSMDKPTAKTVTWNGTTPN